MPTWPEPRQIIGAAVPRVDGALKVSGRLNKIVMIEAPAITIPLAALAKFHQELRNQFLATNTD